MLARFPGNFQEHPASSNWVMNTALHAKINDSARVANVLLWDKSDTPIDMVRNQAVEYAQRNDVDVLFMIDSDMHPDQDGGKKFYDVAMEFLHGRIAPAVIAAPYVGGGEHNNIFVFRWRNVNNGPNPNFCLEQYTREEAAYESGVTQVASMPTGLIAYDMRVFARLDPKVKGYFYYEMNETRTKKESTEDVTNTRDISLAWSDVPGAGCYCAWDCWANHLKIVPCMKPRVLTSRVVGESLRKAFSGSGIMGEFYGEVDPVKGFQPTARKVSEMIVEVTGEAKSDFKDRVRKAFPEYVNGDPQDV
jgi:hypothetical protein